MKIHYVDMPHFDLAYYFVKGFGSIHSKFDDVFVVIYNEIEESHMMKIFGDCEMTIFSGGSGSDSFRIVVTGPPELATVYLRNSLEQMVRNDIGLIVQKYISNFQNGYTDFVSPEEFGEIATKILRERIVEKVHES